LQNSPQLSVASENEQHLALLHEDLSLFRYKLLVQGLQKLRNLWCVPRKDCDNGDLDLLSVSIMTVASFDSERQLQAALGVMFPDLEYHGLF
jgi:hypothetical protein